MRLLRSRQPEAIKNFTHLKPARLKDTSQGVCEQRCPGEPFLCSRVHGHSDSHVAYGPFRWGRLKGILAVWGDQLLADGVADDVEWTLHGGAQSETEDETDTIIDRGMDALGRGDYAAALRAWIPDAEQGNSISQTNVAGVYQVVGHHRESLRWHRRAAEQESAESQFQIGLLYLEGEAIAADESEAVRWWSKAADQGHAVAQYNLGRMYLNGWGTPQDLKQAYLWFHLAASGYQELVNQGFSMERHTGEALSLRIEAESSMTQEQIEEAERLVEGFRPKTE